ncbi:MAG: cold shock domain-containing protein [Pirellulaceae bacterium]|nr:cold shock domain-containing protein [Pirellulaceae bacterium]
MTAWVRQRRKFPLAVESSIYLRESESVIEGEIQHLVIEKGFGFIKSADSGDDVFFHQSAVNAPLDTLAPGQPVRFELDPKSEKPRAGRVQIIAGASPNNSCTTSDRNSVKRFTSKSRDPRSSTSQHRSPRPRFGRAPTDWKQGFVTKLHRKTYSGFISSIEHGPEYLFAAESVSGEKQYSRLSIGDYVQFIVGKPDPETPKQPIASEVQVIEKDVKHDGNKQLARHPKARKRKPSWR